MNKDIKKQNFNTVFNEGIYESSFNLFLFCNSKLSKILLILSIIPFPKVNFFLHLYCKNSK